jgi:hypothetical protein
MKKNPRKMAMIGLAASMLFTTTSCGVNRGETDYGPPITDPVKITTESNEIEAVYGPPEDMTEEESVTTESEGENTEAETTEEISVFENELEDVYGPPIEDQ